MFDIYIPPFTIEYKGHRISVEKEQGNLIYTRDSEYGSIEKVLLDADNGFLINPIEPVNLPKQITSFLLVDFERPILVGPGSKQKIYLTFPVEIGIFIISKNGDHDLIDMFTLNMSKYTLYGTPNRGMICRYWKSEVFSSYPNLDTRYEGDIELDIINDTNHWIEVTRAVFNAFGMKIYYGADRISMRAYMRVINRKLAETGFMTYTVTAELRRSVELYTARRLMLSGIKGIMEHGL